MGRLICLALTPASLAPILRVASAAAWGTDRFKSLCFDQAEMAFTPGVLAFTRVVIADRIGDEAGASEVSVAPGQILDADIYFNSGDPTTTFATPLAVAANPKSYAVYGSYAARLVISQVELFLLSGQRKPDQITARAILRQTKGLVRATPRKSVQA